MASSDAKSPVNKPTFASVAAKAPPRSGPTIIGQEPRSVSKAQPNDLTDAGRRQPPSNRSISKVQQDLNASMSKLDIKGHPPTSNALNDVAKTNIKRAGLRVDDDSTLISSSTNANSIDGKSTASGMTFAFDEKESLRPDDSASVQAVDDDDVNSANMSGAANSRIGSESGSRAFRDQFNEVSQNASNHVTRMHPLSQANNIENGHDSAAAPREQDAVMNPSQSMQPPPVATEARPQMPFGDLQPDKKLFEALDSPKDRMFLLRLEQDIVVFIEKSREPKIQLPPCNSFCRLLAHKLADYYGLTHFYESAQNSINLFRTPYCHLRTPLSDLVRNVSQDTQPSITAPPPAMKIMRRPELVKVGRDESSGAPTAESSVVPSKAGSEAGDGSRQGTGTVSPTESNLTKERANLSLAEREARYKEKREQIFGPQKDNPEGSEAVNDVSRVSSRNEDRKKKRKPKVNNDDFDGRSAYNAYYPNMTYSPQSYNPSMSATSPYSPYAVYGPQQTSPSTTFFNHQMTRQGFQQPPQGMMPHSPYVPFDQQMQAPLEYSNSNAGAGYDQQAAAQYQAPTSMVMMTPGLPPTAMPPYPIEAQFYPSHGHHQMVDHSTPRSSYSQLSYQQDGQQQFYANNVHHAPGSLSYHPAMTEMQNASGAPNHFSRNPPFNPQTRSFIPNGATQLNPMATQNGGAAFMNNKPFPKVASNGGHVPSHPLVSPLYSPTSKEIPRASNTRRSNIANGEVSSPAPSSLSKWTTPANLPPKPPPPDTPGMPDSLPSNSQFAAKMQPMAVGQSMPHYQNGVYSMPRAGR